MVTIRLPPPTRNVSPVVTILPPKTKLIRIYDPTKYSAKALSFRSIGPISRFDHHKTSPDLKPQLDPERSIIYGAFTLSSCLVEIFGDFDIIEVKQQQVASIELTKSLTLLDLRGNNAMKAGTVSAISKTANRNLSQTWSRYFYEQSSLYGEIDGLIYSNAHNDEDAVALYQRAITKLTLAKVQTMSLNHPALRSAIFQIAQNHSLLVSPY
ncbi:MAG: RES family NAD+ phosphorylase [Gomphosphaeria aponina SAG 52.96 = DSM 107014]|uniref:RES family NAD+ phosphorylase n=1 Tax=Gomphosphaeria aponina SAG 52.96 = DSM 107014 TaxID=1521640 RepID=A0A941JMC4_9CHRO|nr:RES family NAD+ phosphorylase [Gomphosphaeria aponina SAG 52.96 = DSM 107014]